MGHSQSQKAKNRELLLARASEQIRSGGFSSINVGSLMKTVGLTHGGFYGHFKSKDALLTEALKRALVDGETTARTTAKTPKRGFGDVVRSYLSKQHRKTPEHGCAISALISDVARADKDTRSIMETHIDAFIDKTAISLDNDHQQASLAVSAMVGALALSRIITDDRKADKFITGVRDTLLKQFAE